jgi:hypothetical protein
MRPLLVASLLMFGAAKAQAGSIDDLFASAPAGPIRIGHAHGYVWAEYCPDETCDVVRTRSKVSRRDFEMLALSYFLYASEYIYLREWKNRAETKAQAEATFAEYDARVCSTEPGEARAKCVLKALASAYDVEVLFIRRDERRVSVDRKRLSAVLAN